MTRKSRYVVVVGPDGSGKTTVADRLAVALAERVPVRRVNFSFGHVPSISRVLRRERPKPPPEGTRDAGMVGPQRRMKAVLLGIWYGVDHVLGHLTLWRARPGEVVIFARSYHDFLYQRAYANLPQVVTRFFLALGPKPDLVATPVREPADIHRAKPELTVNEITEQYARIVRGLQRYPYFAEIDASAGIEDTVRQIRERMRL